MQLAILYIYIYIRYFLIKSTFVVLIIALILALVNIKFIFLINKDKMFAFAERKAISGVFNSKNC